MAKERPKTPFLLYQLAGFGTLQFIVSKPINWIINIGILGLIIASCVAYRQGGYGTEQTLVGLLFPGMAIAVFYGVLKLRQMQMAYDLRCPPKPPK